MSKEFARMAGLSRAIADTLDMVSEKLFLCTHIDDQAVVRINGRIAYARTVAQSFRGLPELLTWLRCHLPEAGRFVLEQYHELMSSAYELDNF